MHGDPDARAAIAPLLSTLDEDSVPVVRGTAVVRAAQPAMVRRLESSILKADSSTGRSVRSSREWSGQGEGASLHQACHIAGSEICRIFLARTPQKYPHHLPGLLLHGARNSWNPERKTARWRRPRTDPNWTAGTRSTQLAPALEIDASLPNGVIANPRIPCQAPKWGKQLGNRRMPLNFCHTFDRVCSDSSLVPVPMRQDLQINHGSRADEASPCGRLP